MDPDRLAQDQLKRAVALAARDHLLAHLPVGAVLGVGTGTTVAHFIEALATMRDRLTGAVASSEQTRRLLLGQAIPVIDLDAVDGLPIYVDGADEIDHELVMLKGGGGALTREKIVAAVARTFVCICDERKLVSRLGGVPLPIEVIPMARAQIARAVQQLGGHAVLRADFVTDNGNLILDAHGLDLGDPLALEARLDQLAGVVAHGLFARRRADVLLVAGKGGVRTLTAELR